MFYFRIQQRDDNVSYYPAQCIADSMDNGNGDTRWSNKITSLYSTGNSRCSDSTAQQLATMSVQPFQFEPERIVRDEDIEFEHLIQNEDEGDTDQRGEEARVGQNSWCLCTKCVPMSKEKESICCKELNFLSGNVQGKL